MTIKIETDYWLVTVLQENTKRFEELPVALSRARFSYIDMNGNSEDSEFES